eukprot:10762205-Alexandrium_andersonii.AAC.1
MPYRAGRAPSFLSARVVKRCAPADASRGIRGPWSRAATRREGPGGPVGRPATPRCPALLAVARPDDAHHVFGVRGGRADAAAGA